METTRGFPGVDELIKHPIQLTELIRKSLEDADSFRQECQELWKKVELLGLKLKTAARVGPGNLYGRPTRRIMAEVEKTLEKALALVKKCKRSGILKRVITITSAADFKKVNLLLDNGIADVSWLLNVSAVGEDRPESGGVPPIALTDPVLATIWQEIATVQVGSLEAKTESASTLASYAQIHERNGKLIIEEGGLPPLLRLLKEGNVPAQVAAAECLGVLARDPQRVQEVLEERAVEVFIGILTNGSMKVQVKVAWALAEMVEHSEQAQEQFAQAGAIRLLVSLLAYDTLEETSQIQKAISLHALVVRQKEWAEQTKQGTPSKPVDGEDASSDKESRRNGSPEVREFPKPKTDISVAKPYGLEGSRLGPAKPPSGYAKPGPGFTLPRSSEFRITSFDHRTSPDSRIVGHHGISRQRQERDKEDPETKQNLKAEAAYALWKLASDNVKNSKSITDTRALLCFAKMIESGEGKVRMNSVKAVMEIARAAEQDAELRRAAFKTNSPAAKAVVEQLLRVIEDGDSDLQVPCIRAVGCLARIFPAPAAKVIKPVTNQLANSGLVAEEACIALQKFAVKDNYLHMQHSRTILEGQGAGHLVQLIYFDPQAKIEALYLLSYLALNIGDSDALEKAASLGALEAATRGPELPEELKMLLFEAIQHLEVYQAGPRALPLGANFLV